MTGIELVAAIKAFWPLLAIAGAWGGAKVALNGTRERVKDLEKDVDEIKVDTIDRLARIETKLDALAL